MKQDEQSGAADRAEDKDDTRVEFEDLEPGEREADQVKGGRDPTKASGTSEPTN